MSEAAQTLLPEMNEAPESEVRVGTGVFPSQLLHQLIRRKTIQATEPIEDEQVQPASLDLRLGATAYRIRASFLPGKDSSVEDKLSSFALHKFDLTEGAVLEKGCVYLVKLLESVDLTRELYGIANPKSSIGRLDVFTRVIADGASQFDRIRAGYCGPLYAEISPLTFSIVARKGSRLSQLRIKRGSPVFTDEELAALTRIIGKADAAADERAARGAFPITVDVVGDDSDLIGYRAKRHAPFVDVDLRNHHPVADFWEPVHVQPRGGLILDPGDFYILASKEAITVPPDHAAEMVAYDTLVGEFRVHYAGFFDPGFGHADSGGAGTKAVLEVRSHEVPFLIEDGQTVGQLIYEKLAAPPDKLYGTDIGSHYQRQGLQLSKHFKR